MTAVGGIGGVTVTVVGGLGEEGVEVKVLEEEHYKGGILLKLIEVVYSTLETLELAIYPPPLDQEVE